MSEPGFWDDQDSAQAKSQSLALKKQELEIFNTWNKRLVDLLELEELKSSAEEQEKQQYQEMILEEFNKLNDEFKVYEFQRMMSGDYDKSDAIIAINAGAGGTDAQDWAEMLLRMYMRWAENIRGYTVELIDRSDGEEAGL